MRKIVDKMGILSCRLKKSRELRVICIILCGCFCYFFGEVYPLQYACTAMLSMPVLPAIRPMAAAIAFVAKFFFMVSTSCLRLSYAKIKIIIGLNSYPKRGITPL